MILVLWMLSFKPTFSLSSFTFIKRLFSSSSLSAIRVVASAYEVIDTSSSNLFFSSQQMRNKCLMSSDSYVFSDSLIAQIPSFLKMIWCNIMCVCVCVFELLSRVRFLATPWTIARQAPLSMGFSRQEYWSGLPFPSPGDLPNLEIEPGSPALQADSLPSEPQGKPQNTLLSLLLSRSVVSDYLQPCGLQLQRYASEDLPLPGPSGCPRSQTAAARPYRASPSCMEAPRSAPSAHPRSQFWTARSGSSSSRSAFHSEADTVESHSMATRSSQTYTVPNFPDNMAHPDEKGLPPKVQSHRDPV